MSTGRQQSLIGTQQGAVVFPLLVNISLHFSFKQGEFSRGEVTIIRYADDAVLGFQ